MRVNPYFRQPAFGNAQLNIMATSDNHGKIDRLPDMLDTLIDNKDEVFPKAEALNLQTKDSVKNIGVFNGDWFMNPLGGHYLTFHNKRAGDFQLLFLRKFIEQVKKPLKQNFEGIISVGNHCLDGGDRYFLSLATKPDNNFTTVLSNANFENSPAINDLSERRREKIKQKVILEIPDDKNKDMKHKVMLLGVTIMGVDFYNPEIVDDIDFIDRTDKKDAKINSEDITKTYEHLNKTVQEFKKVNPKGVVVLMAHTGNKISKYLAYNVKDVDLVLNGHDHKDVQEEYETPFGTKIPILSLGDDSKFFDSIHLKFDDEGNSKIDYKKIDTKESSYSKYNTLGRLMGHYFSRDKAPYFFIDGEKGTNLSQKGVRGENNLLANFVTDGIVEGIRKHDPEVELFCVASSAFRQDLKVGEKGNSNIELQNLLSGQTDALSKIYTAKLSGKNIISMVKENLEDHKKNPSRNTILQWSGLKINKEEIFKLIDNGEADDPEKMKKFIKVKNRHDEYDNINTERRYKIAIPNYFFKRPKLPTAMKLEDSFTALNKNMDELFREYLKDNNFAIKAPNPDDVRIE